MNTLSRKNIIVLVIVAIMIMGSTMSVFAATGYQGYSLYRDGLTFDFPDWHAGIMIRPYISYSYPVAHIGGLGEGVTLVSFSEFMNGKTFMGYYRPQGGISSSGRDLVVGMSYNLAYEDLGYTLLGQLSYYHNHPKIEPEDIELIRCDGVVEYCFEYYGYRIYGSDSRWNISIPGNPAYHMGFAITPKKQAQNYMTPVY